MAVTARKSAPYEGPECPRCAVLLSDDARRSGRVTCANCGVTYESTAFTPPQRRMQIVEVAQSGPEGANACANHERNVAVTSCQRCGLYICALCDMNVGTGSYCPACFDRVTSEGSLPAATTRFRDYASMARVAAIVGFVFMALGILFGPLTIVYATKALKQAVNAGRPKTGIYIAMAFGILETLAGVGFGVLMVLAAMGKLD
jgi:ribosomal protein S27AE